MLVFSVSDKGGTGRSVTSTNLAYRSALRGNNTCYLDFDFGSPTIGSIFDLENARRGVAGDGLHDYLRGIAPAARRIDVWAESSHEFLRRRPGDGALTLLPGSHGGAEFDIDKKMVERCVDLFVALDEEYDLCVVDLSAGRSFAVELVLQATARQSLRGVPARWLVFHKWTRQHVIAANSLVYGEHGLLESGKTTGHTEDEMRRMIRFVRTAVIDPYGAQVARLSGPQQTWLQEVNRDLEKAAAKLELGRAMQIGTIPLDPVLQWREQLILDRDVHTTEVANQATVDAFENLAGFVADPELWEGS
ncbi:MAG: SCO2523 family variant P-loop protein [Actinocrinis sp.]